MRYNYTSDSHTVDWVTFQRARVVLGKTIVLYQKKKYFRYFFNKIFDIWKFIIPVKHSFMIKVKGKCTFGMAMCRASSLHNLKKWGREAPLIPSEILAPLSHKHGF